MRRNPQKSPHRTASWKTERTQERVRQYYCKKALLDMWESEPDDVQIANHDYIIGLRARVRRVQNYLLHRADRNAQV